MHSTRALLFTLSVSLAGAACAVPTTRPVPGPGDADPSPLSAQPPMPVLDGEGVIYVATEQPSRPRTRYLDGQLSLGSHCAIRVANKLNRRIPPVYVNGQPVGFC